MPARLIVTADAAQDLADTRKYYDEQLTGLGEDFLLAADATVRSVLDHPEMYQVIRRRYRRALLRRFPYAVYTGTTARQ